MLHRGYDDARFSRPHVRPGPARRGRVLAARERRATAQLIAALVELDTRRLYLGEGCSSLFTYCTQILHLSEHAAYGRIEAARAVRRFPLILELLADGSVTLTVVGLLAPHLTPENYRDALAAARHKSKRDVAHLVAGLRPRPVVPSSVRKLPAAKPTEVPGAQPALDVLHDDPGTSLPACTTPPPKRPDVMTPLAPGRYKVQFTASRETYEKLRRAQDLLRHTIPDGDLAAIVDRALTLLVSDLERTKLAATARPRAARLAKPGPRRIPAVVKREVWARDGGQCAFVGTNGRCTDAAAARYPRVSLVGVGRCAPAAPRAPVDRRGQCFISVASCWEIANQSESAEAHAARPRRPLPA